MPPHRSADSSLAKEAIDANKKNASPTPYVVDIVWRKMFVLAVLHVGAVYALSLLHTIRIWTWFWSLSCFFAGGLGIYAGAHRLWSHKSYKATWSLRVALMIMNCMSLEDHIHEWARDHRIHHKFSDTDADPHNSKRGFFFAHIGWLMVKRHPDVETYGGKIDLSDLNEDKIVMFQKRFYLPLAFLFCVVMPTIVPYFLWNETLWNGFFVPFMLRCVLSLNAVWSVNSVAHMWGNKPYDKSISPTDSPIPELLSCGEGFHNYHHTFPYDYSASELSKVTDLFMGANLTTLFIDACAWMGLAYDRRTASKEVILQRRMRTGNLQHLKDE